MFKVFRNTYHAQAAGAAIHIQIRFTHFLIGRSRTKWITLWLFKPTRSYGWLYLNAFGHRIQFGQSI